jgi:hypothetical protein
MRSRRPACYYLAGAHMGQSSRPVSELSMIAVSGQWPTVEFYSARIPWVGIVRDFPISRLVFRETNQAQAPGRNRRLVPAFVSFSDGYDRSCTPSTFSTGRQS